MVKPLVTHPGAGPIYKGDTISTQTGDTGLEMIERMLSAGAIGWKSPTRQTKRLFGTSSNLIRAENQRTGSQDHQRRLISRSPTFNCLPSRSSALGRASARISSSSKKQTNKDKLNTVPQQVSWTTPARTSVNLCSTGSREENAFILPRENARKEESTQQSAVRWRRGPVKFVRMAGRRPSRRCCRAGNCSPTRPRSRTRRRPAEDRRRDCQDADDGPGDVDRPLHVVKKDGGFSSASNMSSGRSRITKRATTSPQGFRPPRRPCRSRHGPRRKVQPPRSSFIGKASRRPFNRYLANALKNLGASSTIARQSGRLAIQYSRAQELRCRLQLAHRYGGAFTFWRGRWAHPA